MGMTVREMALLLKPSRAAVLLHCRNEGLRKRYKGLHQWNVDAYKGRLLLWGPDGSRWDVGELLQPLGVTAKARIVTTNTCVKVCALLWRGKASGAPVWQDEQCQPL